MVQNCRSKAEHYSYCVNIIVQGSIGPGHSESNVARLGRAIIIDDKPVYQNGKIWNISPNARAVSGNAFDCFMQDADDPGAFEWLADENTLAAIRKYGQLELSADGNYTFTPASFSGQPDAVFELPFGYAVRMEMQFLEL